MREEDELDPAVVADKLRPFLVTMIEGIVKGGGATGAGGSAATVLPVHDLATAHSGNLPWSRVEKAGSSIFDLGNSGRIVLTNSPKTILATHTFNVVQNMHSVALSGSQSTWSSAGWGTPIKLPGPGQAMVWPKGATARSWAIGPTAGNLYFAHSAADDASASAAYDLVLDGTFLRSGNYATRLSGWGIDSQNGAGDFQYLFAKQLHAEIFVADVSRALAGIEIVTKSVTLLDSDFIIPFPGQTSTLRVKDLPSAAGMQVFEPGDYVNPPTFDRSGGALTIGDCWGTVSNPVDNGNGTQEWMFTRTGTVTYKTITQRGSVLGVSSSGDATVTLAKPTGVVNLDFILVQINYVGTHTLTPPAGHTFTRLIQSTTGGNTMEVWYRLAGASEPSNYVFTFASNVTYTSNIVAYQNVGTVGIYIDGSLAQVNASSTSMTVATGLTPRSAAGMLLFYGMAAGNIRATPPSGMTELSDAGVSSVNCYLASQMLASSGTIGAKTATLASAAANAAALVVLMPGYTALSTQAGAAVPLTTITAQHGNEGAVLDYGVAGNGYVEINAIDGIRGVNSPYIRVVVFAGHPADSKLTVGQFGNLRGLFGVGGEQGLYVGDGTGATNKFFRVSSYTQEIHNLPIKMYSGSTQFLQMDTAGLTYYVTAAGTYADATSILFKRQSDGATKILRLAGINTIGGGHEGSLELNPGTADSLLHIHSQSPTGYYANIELTCRVNATSKQWLFKHLSDGTVGAHFPGFLDVGGQNTLVDGVLLVNGRAEFAGSVAQNYRASVEVDSASTYFLANLYYNGSWLLHDAGRAPAAIQMVNTSSDSYIKFETKDANSAPASERMRITKSGYVAIGGNTPNGMLDIDQPGTAATVPVLVLNQADVSEEFIQFDGAVAAGNPIDTAAIGTYYGKIRVSVNGTFKYMELFNS